jgi:hypothetical protein
MHLVFGSRSTATADVEELLVEFIQSEHAAVLDVLGAKYCRGIGQVGEDGRNHHRRPVQILDPYLDVAVTHSCRREWCRLFEKVSCFRCFRCFRCCWLRSLKKHQTLSHRNSGTRALCFIDE